MEIFYGATLGIWTIGLLFAWGIWLWFPTVKSTTLAHDVSFSVLIPVRNEVQNLPGLLYDLANQSKRPAEVWILDDSSTDGTAELVRAWQTNFPVPLHLWHSDRPENSPISPKKYALTALMPQLQTDWIVTTDGDCRVSPNWLETLAGQTPNRVFLAGPISFLPQKKAWVWAQIIELASLQLTAAVTLLMKIPTMCSAANMAFQRATFPGYAGNAHIASGDDEFLMHAYQAQFPGQVAWVKSPHALVLTQAQTSWSGFIAQRKRWASKWNRYTSWFPRVLAVFVFLVNVATLSALVTGDYHWLFLRWSVEIGALATFLAFFGQKKWIAQIPIVQIFYPLYVVYFGLIAQRKSTYVWKGRQWD